MVGDYYGLGGHMGFMGYGIFIQILLFVAFLLIMFWVVKSGNISNDTADEILKKRFVKGEITKKEYNDLKKEISK
ncbi:MAG: SHOCT domain-containing protein [Candidatus Woesearchaeota archaeon]|jgi:putative membrane protein|nr:SHOCT domain-containing protein [Candidatus Woesearchaeota archaeon]